MTSTPLTPLRLLVGLLSAAGPLVAIGALLVAAAHSGVPAGAIAATLTISAVVVCGACALTPTTQTGRGR